MAEALHENLEGERDATIHDIGYRRYEGRLLGPAGAWRALYWQGFRAMFGIGRSGKAKLVPLFVLVATMLPALAMLTAATASKGLMPIQYAALINPQIILYVLFVAAQAPEILSRDQQFRMLPLVLTRQVTRTTYATARFLALLSAVMIVATVPSLLMYIGEIGSAVDPAAAFDKMGHRIWPILAQGAATAVAIGGVGAAFAAWTPRRAYATAAIIGTFLVTAAVAAGLEDLGASLRLAELLNPALSLITQAHLLFDETTRAMELHPPLPLSNYFAYHAALGLAGFSLLLWRIRRVSL
jgi:ABC-2 type transport system permease protein